MEALGNFFIFGRKEDVKFGRESSCRFFPRGGDGSEVRDLIGRKRDNLLDNLKTECEHSGADKFFDN